jgi:hypothetical protein
MATFADAGVVGQILKPVAGNSAGSSGICQSARPGCAQISFGCEVSDECDA